MSSNLVLRHSREFVSEWREIVKGLFGWKQTGEFLRVKSIFGRPTLSYLPLLNYTDLDLEGSQSLISSAQGHRYLIRVLDGDDTGFSTNDPVCLRIAVDDKVEDDIWRKSLKSRTRNRVKKSWDSGLDVVLGNDAKIVDDFYRVYARTVHRLGSPAVPRELFTLLGKRLGARYIVVYFDQQPVAALATVLDNGLLWAPYIGSLSEYWDKFSNYLLYWETIREGIRVGAQVVDFGRSSYGGTHYQFKRQWGAKPVKVRLLQPEVEDVYARYSMAARLWRYLPDSAANTLGPRLIRHLADY